MHVLYDMTKYFLFHITAVEQVQIIALSLCRTPLAMVHPIATNPEDPIFVYVSAEW